MLFSSRTKLIVLFGLLECRSRELEHLVHYGGFLLTLIDILLHGMTYVARSIVNILKFNISSVFTHKHSSERIGRQLTLRCINLRSDWVLRQWCLLDCMASSLLKLCRKERNGSSLLLLSSGNTLSFLKLHLSTSY